MQRKKEFNMQKITAFFSLLSAVGVIYVGYILIAMQADLEKLDQEIQHEEIMLEIKRFEAAQRKEKNKLISKYIPKLIYGDETVKHELLDILSVLYPNEAGNIMRNIDVTLEKKKMELDQAFRQTSNIKAPVEEPTEEEPKHPEEWAVVVSTDKSIEAAEHEVTRAKDQNYSPMIYKKGRRYITILGPYANRSKVEKITERVQKNLNETSYIISYQKWCKQQVARDQYVECAI